MFSQLRTQSILFLSVIHAADSIRTPCREKPNLWNPIQNRDQGKLVTFEPRDENERLASRVNMGRKRAGVYVRLALLRNDRLKLSRKNLNVRRMFSVSNGDEGNKTYLSVVITHSISNNALCFLA